MTAPGQIFLERDVTAATGTSIDTGRGLIVAEAARGPLVTPADQPLRSYSDVLDVFGDPTAYSYLHDEAELFFARGGAELHVGLGRSAGATTAQAPVGTNQGTMAASSPGAWANGWTYETIAGSASGTFVYVIEDANGTERERSRDLVDQTDAQLWSRTARFVRYTPGTATADPAPAGPIALTGGDDNRVGVTSTAWIAAIDRLAGRGPGQLFIPGIYTPTVHAHAADRALIDNTCPVLDLQRGASVSAMISAAQALQQASDGARRCVLFGQSGVMRARRGGAGTRSVPVSGDVAGAAAAYDATGHYGDPIANTNGRSSVLIGLDRVFTDDERSQLNDAGVSVYKLGPDGAPTIYANRSAAKATPRDVDYEWSAARTTMTLRARQGRVLEQFVLKKIDGRGKAIAQAYGAVSGEAKTLYDDDALYGATPDEAYTVDVSYDLETHDLQAVCEFAPSPSSQTVTLVSGRRAPRS